MAKSAGSPQAQHRVTSSLYFGSGRLRQRVRIGGAGGFVVSSRHEDSDVLGQGVPRCPADEFSLPCIGGE